MKGTCTIGEFCSRLQPALPVVSGDADGMAIGCDWLAGWLATPPADKEDTHSECINASGSSRSHVCSESRPLAKVQKVLSGEGLREKELFDVVLRLDG